MRLRNHAGGSTPQYDQRHSSESESESSSSRPESATLETPCGGTPSSTVSTALALLAVEFSRHRRGRCRYMAGMDDNMEDTKEINTSEIAGFFVKFSNGVIMRPTRSALAHCPEIGTPGR